MEEKESKIDKWQNLMPDTIESVKSLTQSTQRSCCRPCKYGSTERSCCRPHDSRSTGRSCRRPQRSCSRSCCRPHAHDSSPLLLSLTSAILSLYLSPTYVSLSLLCNDLGNIEENETFPLGYDLKKGQNLWKHNHVLTLIPSYISWKSEGV